MTILNTYTFSPELAECMDEAFERATIEPKSIGQEHITSALRSIKFMLNAEWSTLGIRQWMVVQGTQTVTDGDASYDLPAGTIDVIGAVLRRSGKDTPMYPMSRGDYLNITDKTIQGRPNQYFVDRRYDRCTMYLWQTPENSTDIVVFDYLRQLSDVGGMANTLHMPVQMMEAFICGLTARLCEKFKRDLFAEKLKLYRGNDPLNNDSIGGALGMAIQENRERADAVFTISNPRYGRGR